MSPKIHYGEVSFVLFVFRNTNIMVKSPKRNIQKLIKEIYNHIQIHVYVCARVSISVVVSLNVHRKSVKSLNYFP